jgi:hypothetical protein
MGLPARQRRTLEHIEGTLRRSDPKLALLFSTFGRLTRDEAMPAREAVKHGVARVMAWLRGLRRVRLRPRAILRSQPGMLFLPIALVLIAGSITLAVLASGSPPCGGTRHGAATRQEVASASTTRACNPTSGFPTVMGK